LTAAAIAKVSVNVRSNKKYRQSENSERLEKAILMQFSFQGYSEGFAVVHRVPFPFLPDSKFSSFQKFSTDPFNNLNSIEELTRMFKEMPKKPFEGTFRPTDVSLYL
jgi:hypothetical protein